MRIIKLDDGYKLWGRQGENKSTTLQFDMSEFLEEYPDGMPMVAFERANGDKYYIDCTVVESSMAMAILSSVDTEFDGTVYAEIQWIQDDTVVKSKVYKGRIEKSIHNVGDVPEEQESSWQQQMTKNIGTLAHLNTNAKTSLVAAINELYNIITDVGYYRTLHKIKDYLYEVVYDDIDYDFAKTYYENNGSPLQIGACSSVRNGNYYGRNFDWLYSNQAEFVVHTIATESRNAVLGVTGAINQLTNDFVESGKKSIQYKILPFSIVDGINDHGLVVNTNVVPMDKGINYGIPLYDSEVSVSVIILTRYILDNFNSAQDAIDYICEHVTIYPDNTLRDMHYELHWMVADNEKTFLLELVDNVAVATEISEHPYMTNFYLNNVTFNSDGTVYAPYTQDSTHNAINTNGITENGSGLERWNYIVNHYEPTWTKAGMRSLMDGLMYTNAYTITNPEDVWYTEFSGMGDTTVATPYINYTSVLNDVRNAYAERDRNNPQLWQTVHSAVYNMSDKILYLITQEDGEELQFRLNELEEV